MQIVVCVKITPDAGDIETRPDGSISLERAEWIIGPFDLQALEAGVRLAESEPDSQVTVLSAGPPQVNQSRLKKDVLSRGPDKLVMVADDALANADTALTSAVLEAAVQRLGSVDLVLTGEGSADLYFQQVGLQLGERLGWPTLNAIRKITPQQGSLRVERDLEDELEVLDVPLPAVLSVTTDINPTRLPTLKEILKASQKPVTVWKLNDLDLSADVKNCLKTIQTMAPPQVERKGVMIEGTPDQAAQQLVGYLKKEGII